MKRLIWSKSASVGLYCCPTILISFKIFDPDMSIKLKPNQTQLATADPEIILSVRSRMKLNQKWPRVHLVSGWKNFINSRTKFIYIKTCQIQGPVDGKNNPPPCLLENAFLLLNSNSCQFLNFFFKIRSDALHILTKENPSIHPK